MIVCTWLISALIFTLKGNLHGIFAVGCKICHNIIDSYFLLSTSGIKAGKIDGWLVALFSLGALYYWEVYQNKITGRTIVENEIKPFSTLDDFMDSGYRIADGACSRYKNNPKMYSCGSSLYFNYNDCITKKVG